MAFRSGMIVLLAASSTLLAQAPRSSGPALSAAERTQGWRLLFDGETTRGWRSDTLKRRLRRRRSLGATSIGAIVRIGPTRR